MKDISIQKDLLKSKSTILYIATLLLMSVALSLTLESVNFRSSSIMVNGQNDDLLIIDNEGFKSAIENSKDDLLKEKIREKSEAKDKENSKDDLLKEKIREKSEAKDKESKDISTAQSLSTSSTGCTSYYSDSYGSGTYQLKDGQVSPNGKWKNLFNGYGSSGVKSIYSNNVFFESPKVATSPDQTHATLVKSTKDFCDFKLTLYVKTVKQLRQNSPPNPWETAWVLFRYTDYYHYYWFMVKPNGIELGKKDCDSCNDPIDGQKFLVTNDLVKLRLNSWSKWDITMTGNKITIFVDGKKVVDYVDNTMSPTLSKGAIGLYNEDASVQFDRVSVSPPP